MSLDTSLIQVGITWSNVLSSVQEYVSYKYFDEEKMVEIKYTIPNNDTYDYVYIDFDDYRVNAIMDALPGKLDTPDCDFTDAALYIGVEDEDYQKFRFAYHGNGILVETNDELVDEGDLILKIRLRVKEVSSNINKDIEDELKNCYLYLYTGDIDNFYISMKALGHVKKNLVEENKESKPVVKKHYSQIGLNDFINEAE